MKFILFYDQDVVGIFTSFAKAFDNIDLRDDLDSYFLLAVEEEDVAMANSLRKRIVIGIAGKEE